jgi:hypothetical protein
MSNENKFPLKMYVGDRKNFDNCWFSNKFPLKETTIAKIDQEIRSNQVKSGQI